MAKSGLLLGAKNLLGEMRLIHEAKVKNSKRDITTNCSSVASKPSNFWVILPFPYPNTIESCLEKWSERNFFQVLHIPEFLIPGLYPSFVCCLLCTHHHPTSKPMSHSQGIKWHWSSGLSYSPTLSVSPTLPFLLCANVILCSQGNPHLLPLLTHFPVICVSIPEEVAI